MGVRMARPEGDHRKVIESHNYEKAVQGYLASITFADAEVGRLIDALDKSPYAENTIVVLWGDHGWHLGEKLHWRKFSLWEEADRAPLLMVAPGITKPNGRCPRPVSFMDIYPTLSDLCGLPVGEHLSGQSLRPLLENPQAPWDRPAITTHGRNNHAVRSERYRYIRYGDGTEELYDHEDDPMEWTNLAGKADLAPVKKELGKWLPKQNAADAEFDTGARSNRKPKKASKKSSRGG
jgi:arylsulfatase A-like enzyme